MNRLLRPGQVVQTEISSTLCKIQSFLGSGGQGEVYQAEMNGQRVALKWYFPRSATSAQYKILRSLINLGPPNNNFLWPMELSTAADVQNFGYIMALREERFKSIISLMKRRISPSFYTLATVGFQLSDSYLQLHSRGLCYRDISYNNIHFDPATAEIRIGDNDNISVDNQRLGGILGTPRFMAPELVRGEAVPSIQTDLFSLAVLLFYIFMIHHPLEGRKELAIRCFDLPAMTKLYGLEPVFIFDPEDRSNEPVPGEQDNPLSFWPIYPSFLHQLFIRAFTEGIRDPLNGRVREGEWRAAMIRLRDAIVICAHCGTENFYEAPLHTTAGEQPGYCWSCRKQIILPPQIIIGRNSIVLNRDTHLFPHHIDSQRVYDFSEPVAEVTRHPSSPQLWGLKNLSTETWLAITDDQTQVEVMPGRSLTLKAGTTIHFATVEGKIDRL